jgi:RNA-directed DNA polymerase
MRSEENPHAPIRNGSPLMCPVKSGQNERLVFRRTEVPRFLGPFAVLRAASGAVAAWRTMFSKSSPRARNTVGVDGLSLNDFRADEKAALNRLVRDLRHAQFHFDNLRPHLIPKANGKDRLICVPTVQDRIVQRALLDFLSDRYAGKLANKISYGFVKGRGVKKAAKDAGDLRTKHPWVYKTDITSFFDQIDRARLQAALKSIVRERSLHSILDEAIACEIAELGGSVKQRIQRLGIKPGKGVHQGMPLSPFFSNIMLAGFDRAVEQHGLRAVRYADDLIFFASSRAECETLASFCSEQLGRLGLEVPAIRPGSKSVIYEPGEPAEFLGVSLVLHGTSYRVELASAQIQVIRDELLKCGSIPELVSRKISLPKLGHVLALRRNGYLAAYDICHNVLQLEHELANLEQRVLRTIYRDGLGIDLHRLAGAARTFLGLT